MAKPTRNETSNIIRIVLQFYYKSINPFIKLLKKPWTVAIGKIFGVVAIFSLLNEIIQFIQNLTVEREKITAIILILVTLIALYMSYYFFRKARNEQKTRTKRVLLILGSVLGLIPLGIFCSHLYGNITQQNKVIIAIANFYGPEPENYQVNMELYSNLNSMLAGYPDMQIVQLSETITEYEGSKRAIELGNQTNADLIIWGRYSIDSDMFIYKIQIENLTTLKELKVNQSKIPGEIPISGQEHFDFGEILSKNLGSFSLFVSGLARYEAKDYQGAYNRFDEAYRVGTWNDEILKRQYLLYYRSSSRLASQLENKLINISDEVWNLCVKDLDDAVYSLDSNDPFLEITRNIYFLRGFLHTLAHNNELAIKNYTIIINQENQDWEVYFNRALAYLALGDSDSAIKDYKVIIDSCNCRGFVPVSLRNRGSIYLERADNEVLSVVGSQPGEYSITKEQYDRAFEQYKLAENDFSYAISIESNESTNWMLRGLVRHKIIFINSAQNNGYIELALSDYSKALYLDHNNIQALLYRGNLYAETKNFEKAEIDFISATKINPNLPDPYYYLGLINRDRGKISQATVFFKKCLDRLSQDDPRRNQVMNFLNELQEN